MKKKVFSVIVSVVLIVSLFNVTFVSAEREFATPNASGDVIQMTVQTVNGESNYYHVISTKEVTFADGDIISYDVWANGNYSGVGALDIKADNNSVLRDANTECLDGFPLHPHWVNEYRDGLFGQSIDNNWFRREIAVPFSFQGRTSVEWIIAVSKDFQGAELVVRYDNIVVYDQSGNVKAEIYANGLLPESFVHADPGVFTATVQAINLASGNPVTEEESQPAATQSPVVDDTQAPGDAKANLLLVTLGMLSLLAVLVSLKQKKVNG